MSLSQLFLQSPPNEHNVTLLTLQLRCSGLHHSMLGLVYSDEGHSITVETSGKFCCTHLVWIEETIVTWFGQLKAYVHTCHRHTCTCTCAHINAHTHAHTSSFKPFLILDLSKCLPLCSALASSFTASHMASGCWNKVASIMLPHQRQRVWMKTASFSELSESSKLQTAADRNSTPCKNYVFSISIHTALFTFNSSYRIRPYPPPSKSLHCLY